MELMNYNLLYFSECHSRSIKSLTRYRPPPVHAQCNAIIVTDKAQLSTNRLSRPNRRRHAA